MRPIASPDFVPKMISNVTFQDDHTGKAAMENALNNRQTWTKITRNSVFACHLSPVGQQMAIENTVSNNLWSTFVDSINVINCRLSDVMMLDEKYNVSQFNRFWLLSQMRAVRLRLACANAQSHQSYMGLDARIPVFGSVQTTKAQTVQRLCYSLIGKYHI